MTWIDRWTFKTAIYWRLPGWSIRRRFFRVLLFKLTLMAEQHLARPLSFEEAVCLARDFTAWLEPQPRAVDDVLDHSTRVISTFLTLEWTVRHE